MAALQVTIQDTGSTTTSSQGGQVLITGTPTANSTVVVPLQGTGAFSAQVTGAWSGTLAFEESIDGGTTYSITDVYLKGIGQPVQQVTGNCVVTGNGAGNSQVRIRGVAAMSGTANISVLGNVVPDVVHTIGLNGKSGVQVLQVVPPITSASAYAVHNVVGGIQTLTGAVRNPNGRSTLENLTIFDAAATSAAFEMFFFKQKPTNGTYADKGAITINALDIPNLIGKVDVAANNSAQFGTGNNVYGINGIGLVMPGDSSGNVYAVCVTLSAPTWTNTNQLTFNYGLTQA